MKFKYCFLKFHVVLHRLPLVSVFPHSAQAYPILGISFAGLCFFSGFSWSCTCLCRDGVVHRLPQFSTRLCRAVAVQRLPLVLVFSFLGCGCAYVFPGLSFAFARLCLYTGFPHSLSCLCWVIFVHSLPLVLVYPLLGNFAHNMGLTPDILMVKFLRDYNFKQRQAVQICKSQSSILNFMSHNFSILSHGVPNLSQGVPNLSYVIPNMSHRVYNLSTFLLSSLVFEIHGSRTHFRLICMHVIGFIIVQPKPKPKQR